MDPLQINNPFSKIRSNLVPSVVQKFRNNNSAGGSTYSPEDELARLVAISQASGGDLAKPKTSILQTIGRILNVGRAATAGIEQYGGLSGAVQGIKENLDTATIMKQKLGRELTTSEKAQAIAEDIVKDPLTYLTVGLGGGAKVATEAGKITLTEAGTKAFGLAVKDVGEEAATQAFKDGIEKSAPEFTKYIDRGGIKATIPLTNKSTTLVAGDKFAPIVKAGRDTIAKVPALDKTVDLFGNAFVKDYKVTKTINELRRAGTPEAIKTASEMETYLDNFNKFMKGTAAEKERAARAMETIAKQFSPSERENILHIIEDKTGQMATTAAPKLQEGADYLSNLNKTIGEAETERGLLKDMIDNYVPRILTSEAKKAIEKKGGYSGLSKVVSTSLGTASKHRTITDTIMAGEEGLKKMYGVAGDFYVKDPFVTTAVRQDTSIGAQRAQDFLTELSNSGLAKTAETSTRTVNTHMGPKVVEDVLPTIDEATGIKYVQPQNKLLKEAGIVLPEPIAKHVDEVYQNLTNVESLQQFAGIYDKVLNVWKGSVTSLFPSFHARNATGAVYNNWLAGVVSTKPYEEAASLLGKVKTMESAIKPESQVAAMKQLVDFKIVSKSGQTTTGDEIIRAYENLVGRGTGRSADLASDFTKRFDTGMPKLTELPGKLGKATLENVEEHVRLPLFIDTWKKTGSFEDAAKTVFQYHFDYSPQGMTQFENNVMKRAIPFYRWCMPEETEVLTSRGWLKYSQLNQGEQLLTLNINGKYMEWQGMKEYATFPYEGTLMNIKNSHVHFPFTPEHRWVVKESHRDNYEVKRGYELRSNYNIPIVEDYKYPTESELTPQESAILGWILGDGYWRKKGSHVEMVIYQSPKKYLQNIIDLLGENAIARKPHPQTGVVAIQVNGELRKKLSKYYDEEELFSLLSKLNQESLQACWDALIQAEGCTTESHHQTYFAQDPIKNKKTLDFFQILSYLLGKPAHISSAGAYVKRHKTIKLHGTIGHEYYKGIVWCPVTDNGTWVARYNGKVVITGNTRGNIPLQLEQLVKQPGKQAAALRTLKAFVDKDLQGQLPSYIQQGLAVQLGPISEGKVPVLTGFGLPIEDINKISPNQIMNSLSPLVKYPIEAATGQSLFYQKPIEDLGPQFARYYKDYPGLRDILGIKEVKRPDGSLYYTGDANKLYLMQTALGRIATTVGKASDSSTPTNVKALQLLTGVNARTVDLEQEKYYRTQKLITEQGKRLKQAGVVKSYTSYYKPKGITIGPVGSQQ